MIHGYHETRQVFLANGIEVMPELSQAVYNHSPDGFSWGFGGSGPAQLSLAIMLIFLSKEEALKLYQDFKWEVIAKFPLDEDFYLSPNNVREWIEKHGCDQEYL